MLEGKMSAERGGLKLVRRDPPPIVCSLRKDSVPMCLKINYSSLEQNKPVVTSGGISTESAEKRAKARREKLCVIRK